MSFYKNIGSPYIELNITDFEPPYPGGLPVCYKYYKKGCCHLKYYGKDYFFTVQIPELDKYKFSLNEFELRDHFINKTGKTWYRPVRYCNECIFQNPKREQTGIHCLLRRGKSQYRCNRCVFDSESYFKPIDISKEK